MSPSSWTVQFLYLNQAYYQARGHDFDDNAPSEVLESDSEYKSEYESYDESTVTTKCMTRFEVGDMSEDDVIAEGNEIEVEADIVYVSAVPLMLEYQVEEEELFDKIVVSECDVVGEGEPNGYMLEQMELELERLNRDSMFEYSATQQEFGLSGLPFLMIPSY